METDLVKRSQGFVLFAGRPQWLDEALLADLIAEQRSLRDDAIQVDRQAHSSVGARARSVANSKNLVDLVESCAGYSVKASGNANYLYYDRPGAGIDPHIDTDEFPLQVLIMLEQHGYQDSKSTLVVFPGGPKDPVPVPLVSGELVLFKASSVYHGRTNVGGSERAVLLGIGYVRAAE